MKSNEPEKHRSVIGSFIIGVVVGFLTSGGIFGLLGLILVPVGIIGIFYGIEKSRLDLIALWSGCEVGALLVFLIISRLGPLKVSPFL